MRSLVISTIMGNSLVSKVIENLLVLAMVGNLFVVTTAAASAQNQPPAGKTANSGNSSAGNSSAGKTATIPMPVPPSAAKKSSTLNVDKNQTSSQVSSISAQASLWPATTRAEAIQHARANAGRTDPLGPVEGFKPFPSSGPATVRDTKVKATTSQASNRIVVPPPPDGLHLQVPPPPTNAGRSEDLPVSELPVPPERPSIVNKLKLTGIIGQKAIFSITDLGTRRQNKWPRSLMLGAGEHFESVEVVSIGDDSALLEENGEQTTKRLERIR